MQTKIRTAYKNVFLGINGCKSETMLHHYEKLRELFIDAYQDQLSPDEEDEFTDYRMALKSAVVNKKTALAFQMEDHYENANVMIAEAIEGGMIAQQFNDCK